MRSKKAKGILTVHKGNRDKAKKGKLITSAELTRICTEVLRAAGVSEKKREAVAHHLVQADLCGHESHGVAVRLPRYVALIEKGALKPNTRAHIVTSKPGITVLDGKWGFGQVVGNQALAVCIEKAKARGAHSVSFKNSHHIGRLGYYGEIAAREGLLFFMVANVLPGNRVSHPESPHPVMGTNPACLAFKWKNRLILIDTSTSAIAEGKVAVLRAKKVPAPHGVLRDHRGKTSVDPNVLYSEPKGSLWPLGGPESGYKGFALGVLVDMLAGLSGGGGLSGTPVSPGANCGFLHCINLSQIVTQHRIDEMMNIWMKRMRITKGGNGRGTRLLTLPGEPEMTSRSHNQTHGILINAGSWRELGALAERYGMYV